MKLLFVTLIVFALIFSLTPGLVLGDDEVSQRPSGEEPGDPGVIVPCDDDCNFWDLIQLGQNIMDFIIAISIPVAAIVFAWAGFLYMTAAGNQNTIEKAHSIFTKVAIGFILILTSWLIVWLITSTLLDPRAILLEG